MSNRPPIKLKEGVSISGMVPEMLFANNIIADCLWLYDQDPVITAGTDGSHSKSSRHYIGCASNWRTWVLQGNERGQHAVDKIKECLGKEFVVILERTHIHVQFNGSPRASLKCLTNFLDSLTRVGHSTITTHSSIIAATK